MAFIEVHNERAGCAAYDRGVRKSDGISGAEVPHESEPGDQGAAPTDSSHQTPTKPNWSNEDHEPFLGVKGPRVFVVANVLLTVFPRNEAVNVDFAFVTFLRKNNICFNS